MLLRLTRSRLKAEWVMLIGTAILIILYVWFCGLNNRGLTLGSYEMFVHTYGSVSPKTLALSLDMEEPPEDADLYALYEAALLAKRGFLYSRILMSAEDMTFLVLDALAVLLLCTLFQKRRLSQWLSAGYSRGQVFLSITLFFFACAFLMWLAASLYLLSRYHIAFAPEEGAFFRVTQLAWICNVMFNASLAFLSALLLRRPLPAFLAALGAWILLRVLSPDLSISPAVILGSGKILSWDPGMDTSSLAAGNWITLGFLLVVLTVTWLIFRKRGFA